MEGSFLGVSSKSKIVSNDLENGVIYSCIRFLEISLQLSNVKDIRYYSDHAFLIHLIYFLPEPKQNIGRQFVQWCMYFYSYLYRTLKY